MTTHRDLGNRIEAIPGVASAQIDLTDEGPPIARIQLDGTESAEAVRVRVDALLGSQVPASVEPEDRPRKGGLGKGLTEVMSSHDDAAAPKYLSGVPSVTEPLSMVRVAVVETESGVSVEVEDSRGAMRSESVDDGSIDSAVVRAVTALLDPGATPVVDLTDAETPAGAVVVASVVSDDDRSVGSAFVEYGRPWAVASAVLAALRP